MTSACLAIAALLTLTSFRSNSSSGNSERRILAAEPMQMVQLPESTVNTSALHQEVVIEEESEEEASYNEISSVEIEENQAINRLLIEGLSGEIEGLTQIPDLTEYTMETPAEHFHRAAPSQVIDEESAVNQASADEQASPSFQALNSSGDKSQPKTDYESLISNHTPLPAYTISSLLQQIQHYSNTFTIVIYDPQDDVFYALYSKKHHWAASNEKMMKALKSVTYLVRKLFPEKLGEELAFGVSSGDCECTECVSSFVL